MTVYPDPGIAVNGVAAELYSLSFPSGRDDKLPPIACGCVLCDGKALHNPLAGDLDIGPAFSS